MKTFKFILLGFTIFLVLGLGVHFAYSQTKMNVGPAPNIQVKGVLPIANGGTGLNTVGTLNQILQSTGSAAQWTSTLTNIVFDSGGAVVNVMSQGAVGNGSTNDTTAIQNAINTACNGTVYATVVIPGGKTFLIGTGGITVPSNCRITGGGTIIYASSSNAPFVIGSNTEVDHLLFNGSNNIGVAVLGNNSSNNLHVDHSLFENFPNGSLCFATCGAISPVPTNVLIDHNFFQNNEDGAATPPIFNVQCGDNVIGFKVEDNIFVGDGDFDIGVDGCQNVEISGNIIKQGTNGFGGGIQPEATSFSISGLTITNNLIANPHFANGYSGCGIEMHTNGNGGSGLGAHILGQFIVSGNYVTGAPGGGICLLYTTNDTNTPGVVANNFTYKNTGSGLNLQGGNLLVSGNLSMDNTGSGIDIACIVQPCNIVGNTATDDQSSKTQTYGLSIAGSPWGAVTGNGTNDFDGNLTGTVSKGSAFNSPTVY